MRMFTHLAIISAFALLLVAALAVPAYAADDDKDWIKTLLNGQPLIPDACTTGTPSENVNDCGLDQVLQVIVNVSRLIVAFAGSAALLIFVYGGVMWIIAAGSPEKIEQGKTAIVSAAIGIAIILGAWLIVNFTILAITGGKIGETGKIFNRSWFSPPSSAENTSDNDSTQGLNQETIDQLNALPGQGLK